MNIARASMALIVALSVLPAADALAQQGPKWSGSGGWGAGGRYARMYDPKTVETVTGEVSSVDLVRPMKGMGSGVHLTLKTDRGPMSVHLGPSWYLEHQDVKIQPGDRLEITGSRVTVAGQPALIAAEIKKGDEVLKLRDEQGVPAWSGWRRSGG